MVLDPENYTVPDDAPQPIEPDSNGEYSCPICESYTGKRESVEAHITGKSDEQHKGRVGKDYRLATDNGIELFDSPINEAEPMPLTGDSDPELEDTTQDSDDTEPDDGNALGSAGIAVLALIIWWLAQRTGNEDEVQDVWEDV